MYGRASVVRVSCSYRNQRMKRNQEMIQIDDVVVSLDILRECFVCDIAACHGECCIEGDAGAPVTEDEVARLEEVLPVVWDDLSDAARSVIERQGVAYVDADGDLVTSIVDGRDCVFTCRDAAGNCMCAIERACREGRTDFSKPVSCHLYPVRVGDYGPYKALNYHRWDVCKAAVALGRAKGMRVYQFLREPLVRRFGQEWYDELCLAADELAKQGMM